MTRPGDAGAPADVVRAFMDGTSTLRTRLGTQIETFAAVQQSLLKDMECCARDWIAHRREGADAAGEAARRLATSQDFADAFLAYHHWMTGSVARLAAETLELQAHGARIARTIVGALQVPDEQPPASAHPAPAGPQRVPPAKRNVDEQQRSAAA